MKDIDQLMVTVRCLVYNHKNYIRQFLDGIVQQQTNFRYEAIVHDDASTDGSAEIILEYALRYPDIIKPILEKENQYSKHDGSIRRIMNTHQHGKYIALCEGDDYWTDPFKLQKQVDFMENHSDYSCIWTNASTLLGETLYPPYNRYPFDTDVPVEDIIVQGGLWIPTASILMTREAFFSFPANHRFNVGDYPLQMWVAFKGKVRYLSDVTCVYRLSSVGSWTTRVANLSTKNLLAHWEREHKMLQTMDQLSDFKFHEYFLQRWHLYSYHNHASIQDYARARFHWMALSKKYRPLHIVDWCIGYGFWGFVRFALKLKSSLRLLSKKIFL